MQFLGVLAKYLRKATVGFVMSIGPSVHPSVHVSAWDNSATTGRIFVRIYIRPFAKICGRVTISVKISHNNTHFKLKPTYIYDNLLDYQGYQCSSYLLTMVTLTTDIIIVLLVDMASTPSWQNCCTPRTYPNLC